MPAMADADLTQRTIADFGEQWTNFRSNEGYYASIDMLRDHLGPLLDIGDLYGKVVADIGSGTGRIVRMLAAAGAAKIHAFEPSACFDVLKENVADLGERVACHRVRGDQINEKAEFDFVLSFGVVHHIPEPEPVVRAAFSALKPGGRIVLWLYGKEGNELYLRLILPLRRLTMHLSHKRLLALSRFLNVVVGAYARAAIRLHLPLRDYLKGVFTRFPSETRVLVIYDQLNPAYAKYYTADDARALVENAGFSDVALYHRHGYSWTVVGSRPH